MILKKYDNWENVFKFEYDLDHKLIGRDKELRILISEFLKIDQDPKKGINVFLITSDEMPCAEDVPAFLEKFSYIIRRAFIEFSSTYLDVIYLPRGSQLIDRMRGEEDIILRILTRYYAQNRDIISRNEKFESIVYSGWEKIIKAKKNRPLIIVMNTKLFISPNKLNKLLPYLNENGISFLMHVDSDLWEECYKERIVGKITKELILEPLNINVISRMLKEAVDLIFNKSEFTKGVLDTLVLNARRYGICFSYSLIIRCKKYLLAYPKEKLTKELVSELFSLPGGDENAIALMKMTPEEREEKNFLAF